MRSLPPLFALYALLAATPAFAHGSAAEHAKEHHHDAKPAAAHDDHKAPHGGLVKSTKAHRHLELVQRADGYDLYVFDSELKPVDGAVSEGKLVIVAGKQKTEAPLTVQGSQLKASATPPAGKHQVVAQLKLDGKPENVKFDVK